MFEPGTLWRRVVERTERALSTGALERIPTRKEYVEQGGVRFLVPVVESLARKREAGRIQEQTEVNPFLSYQEDLFVAEVSETHRILLNKYNVVEHHLLIVTSEFEEQESWLTVEDFEAMWICMAEFDGLAFYNAGRVAGASQRHKHLQQVPVPLGEYPDRTPIDPLMRSVRLDEHVRTVPGLPFAHAAAGVEWCVRMTTFEAALYTAAIYKDMTRAVGLEQESEPYNLLVTRDWMLLVPRSREMYETLSVNALGFAGSILVRSERELDTVKSRGPWTILQSVSFPA